MNGRINKCTLEMEGVDLHEKDLKPQTELAQYSLQLLTVMSIVVAVGDLTYLGLVAAMTTELDKQVLLYTVICDCCGILWIFVFLKLLPSKRVSFPGMAAIAVTIYIMGQIEYNVAMYDNFSEVGGL
jgi:hypothetical protein